MWKNWTIQKRRYISGLFEVILPAIFVIIFTWARSLYNQDESSIYSSNFELAPVSSCYTFDQPLGKIAYSPNSAWIDEFLKIAFAEASLEFESFDSARSLDDYLQIQQPRNVVGIEFDDSLIVIAGLIRNAVQFKISIYILGLH